jgi:membrane protein DedA with SNARE-associated domain
MFPLLFGALLGADAMVFHLGRKYGRHVPRIPILRRYLTERRLRRTEQAFNRHGGKFIFAARFLPGLRTPAMFTAGTFKVSYWRFLLYDGSAATLSAPTIFFLAYFFEDQLSQVKDWVASGQIAAIVVVVAVIAVFIAIKLWLARDTRRVPARNAG